VTIAKRYATSAKRQVDSYYESQETADTDAHLLREAATEALVSIAYSLATIAERMPRRGAEEV
jgi:hypothetical protein